MFVAHTKPYSANIWRSNLNSQKPNNNGFFVVNSVTASKSVNKKSIEIFIQNEQSIRNFKNDKKIIKVRLKKNKVKLY